MIKLSAFFALSLVACLSIQAQFSFQGSSPDGDEAKGLPENVPTDLIAPRIVSRETAADKLARIFNGELRGIEDRQREILEELAELPEIEIESFLPQAFGYHSSSSRERPKWVQIDLGRNNFSRCHCPFSGHCAGER